MISSTGAYLIFLKTKEVKALFLGIIDKKICPKLYLVPGTMTNSGRILNDTITSQKRIVIMWLGRQEKTLLCLIYGLQDNAECNRFLLLGLLILFVFSPSYINAYLLSIHYSTSMKFTKYSSLKPGLNA